ncbi:MAG: hypothetical protein ACD_79C00252G0011 [uncultured bacterium]|nr:MAG: hypothetical protein ACD_79C00252G0011 [uncultured bacterium]
MKILITGGAGFIGSNLADRLIESGHSVMVIDNFATGKKENLSTNSNLTIIEGSVADSIMVDSLFKQFVPDIVVHAAASYKDPNNWEEDARTNTTGSAIITQASLKYHVKRLIYFQTSLCYGLHPIEQPITIDHPLRPVESSYAISKTAGEYYIALSGLDFISFRLANAYGPRNLSGPLPTFYQRLAAGNPCFVMDTRRDFIFISDLIDIVIMAINGKGKKGFYHVSSGQDYSIEELYRNILKALGRDPTEKVEIRERNPDDAFTILLDPSKTYQDFNWKISTPLEKGVSKAVEWYKKNNIQDTFTHLKNLK